MADPPGEAEHVEDEPRSASAAIEPTRKYRFVAKHSAKCLSVWESSTVDGAAIKQLTCHGGENQQFRVIPVEDDYYMFSASHSRKCLQASGLNNGDPVHQGSCLGGTHQKFKLIDVGAGYSSVQAQNSGKCITVQGGDTEDGAAVIQFDCHGGNNQQFNLIE